MKTSVRMIIAGVAIAVGGLVMFLCALGASGWDIQQGGNWEQDTATFDTPITKLKMIVHFGKVDVSRAEVDNIVITYEYNDLYKTEITMSNSGELTVETPKKEWYNTIQFGTAYVPKMQITIPQDWQPSLDIKLNAGTVEIDGGAWGTSVDVNINAGTLTVGDVSTKELEIKMNAGRFNLGKISCEKSTCKLNAGVLDVEEIVCEEFYCKLNAGSATVDFLDSKRTSLHLSAGAATLKMAGAKSDYNVRVDKSAGSCNVSNSTSNTATRSLDVDLSAGSVNIRFAA